MMPINYARVDVYSIHLGHVAVHNNKGARGLSQHKDCRRHS
jgi:hypothetical protein